MSRPHSNGLVELVDEKSNDKGFFCMDLVGFMFGDETTKTWEGWHKNFMQAKADNCPYRDRCPRYARTVAKRGTRPVQLKLF